MSMYVAGSINWTAAHAEQGMQLLVRSITQEALGIRTFELVHPHRNALPAFEAGAHVDVQVPGGPVRQYSLCNAPAERYRYLIAVLRVDRGRGGSTGMHQHVDVGDLLEVSAPRNQFELAGVAQRHLLIAGGIGVTPLLAMVEALSARQADFRLVYCTRSIDHTAFTDRLEGHLRAGRVSLHHDDGDPARALDMLALLARQEGGTHLYCCGPAGLMQAVKNATAHWAVGSVHFEYFAPSSASTAPADGDGFEVRLARSGGSYHVPQGRSIIDVLRANGVACETSCEAGVCGTCRTPYLEGTPLHQDFVLTSQEQTKFVLICCARSSSAVLVLDR